DDRERCPALLDDRVTRMVGEDEDRDAEGRIVTPPAVRVRIVCPWSRAAAEHPPAHHDRSARVLPFVDDVVVRPRLTPGHAVALAEALEPDRPFVEALAALAQRLLQRLVGPGNVAVE